MFGCKAPGYYLLVSETGSRRSGNARDENRAAALLDQFHTAANVLEAWLEEQPRIGGRLTSALRQLYADCGNISIAQLAAAQGLSSRTNAHSDRSINAPLWDRS